MKKNFFYAGVMTAALLFVGCDSSNSVSSTANHTEHEVHFSYDGETGPDYWGSLKEEWSTCDNGLNVTKVVEGAPHQSPVDFETAVPSDPSFTLDYNKTMAFKMENNGHSVQFNVQEGNPKAYITINEKNYELKQFHFHFVSEHTELEVHAAMEGHFVNVAEDGSIAVVGVFIDNVAGEGNEALGRAFGLEIPEEGEENPNEVMINPLEILPGGKVYSYSGSLTTPPCTEDVAWNIYTKHIGLHEDKVEAFQEHYDHNFRPLTGTY